MVGVRATSIKSLRANGDDMAYEERERSFGNARCSQRRGPEQHYCEDYDEVACKAASLDED
eukprot:12301121-Prorocentrum_lima.AAC.1